LQQQSTTLPVSNRPSSHRNRTAASYLRGASFKGNVTTVLGRATRAKGHGTAGTHLRVSTSEVNSSAIALSATASCSNGYVAAVVAVTCTST
jgi:hypothetical protein